MGYWNYRLTVRCLDDEEVWEVREIFYDDAGQVTAWSQDPVAPAGLSWYECEEEIAHMAAVTSSPVFDLDTLGWVDRERRPTPAPARRQADEALKGLEP